MGVRRSSSLNGRGNVGILKERANMSFMLVVMFFIVFGLIVLTEIFLIDEKRGNNGFNNLRNVHRSNHRLSSSHDKPDYEEIGQDDYIGLRNGMVENFGIFGHNYIGGDRKNNMQLDAPNIPTKLESKLPHPDQGLKITNAEWLPVTNTRYKFFIYSAYFDERVGGGGGFGNRGQNGIVRVIGATKTRGPDKVWCRLWYSIPNSDNVTASVTVAAKVKMIRENWNLKYSACFIICPILKPPKNAISSIPETVSIVSKLQKSPANRLAVQNRPDDRPRKTKSLAVCVKPLHYDFNKVIQLVEFIELHLILGTDHITLYNDTIGTDVDCVLRYYINKGLVNVLPWHHLEMISQREIRTEGLFAALNDCLYRSMYDYDYVALLDLDEFIIPRHGDTILDLIRWMSTKVNNMKNTGAYSFQNSFFYLQWPDDPFVATSRRVTEANLITLRKTRRRTKLHPHKQRSKYLCKPRAVFEAGNHFVWEFVPGFGTVNMPQDSAILHHYRVCEFGGDDCIKTSSVVDRTAYKYLDRLAEQVDITWNELLKICPNMPQLEFTKIDTKKTAASGTR